MRRAALAWPLLAFTMLSSSPGAAQTDTAITVARGAGLVQARNFAEAIRVLTVLTGREPGNGRAWHFLGLAHYGTGNYRAALDANLRAAAVEQTRPTALYNAGLMYALLGEKDSAFAFLYRAKETRRVDLTQISGDSDAVSLRSDPRYRPLFPTREQYAHPFVEPVTILAEWRGEAAGDQFGWIARNVGDLDGDRLADLVTSSPTSNAGGATSGKVYVYSSRTRKVLWTRSGQPGEQLGIGLEAAGDVNRDGTPDVIAGAPGSGTAYVLSGGDGSTLLSLKSGVEGDGFGGGAVSDLGDFNRDGFDDLLVGAPQDDSAGTDAGRVYVLSGRDGTILRVLAGSEPGGRFGASVGGATVQGTTWIVVGAPTAGPRRTGRTYAFSGSGTTPAVTIDSDSTGAALGAMFVSVIGDINHDGMADIYAADYPNAAKGPSTGRVYVHSGRDGSRLLTLTGETAGNGFGVGPADVGDMNGDGYDDLAVGAWQFAGAAPSGGKIYVVSGRDGSSIMTITGNVSGET
ncbi:MAG TPA: FG-GAP-like repeat-containing protein, partial [Acidimicrobiia bacterium]|nr:FG-GAP-like repeat-containing protein [Acidimicrobiia bacterium]